MDTEWNKFGVELILKPSIPIAYISSSTYLLPLLLILLYLCEPMTEVKILSMLHLLDKTLSVTPLLCF
jgi:hypothetical protein